MIVSLGEIKSHLRIDKDYECEDSYIEELIYMAEVDVVNRMKQESLESAFPDGEIPLPVKHAVKLIVSHYYENREPVGFSSSSKIPMMIDSLLFPYIKYNK